MKVRLAGWSLMDTRPLLTFLSDSLVSTIFHGDTHGCLHQYLMLSTNASWYRHSTLRDPPTMPVTLWGPLRDKQPGKHKHQIHQVSLGLGSPGCGSLEGPWGLEEAKAGGRPFLRPRGGRRGKEVPPHRGEGSMETGWEKLCDPRGHL